MRAVTGSLCLVLLLLATAAQGKVVIHVRGINGELEKNVRATLDLARYAERENLSEPAFRRLYDRIPSQTRTALRPFGYYQPQVQTSVSETGGVRTVTIQVTTGEPVHVASVHIDVVGDGAGLPEFRQLVRNPGIAAGDVLSHQAYEKLRSDLQQIAQSDGFFDAEFTEHRLAVNPEKGEADISLTMQTGPRYRFGKVEFEQSILNEDLVDRMVTAEQDEPFDAQKLLDTQYALNDSQYFSGTVVNTGEPDASKLTVPVQIMAQPAPPRHYSIGVGYGTDSGPRITLAADFRRLNRRGHRAAGEYKHSNTKDDLQLQYIIPIGNPARERFAFTGGYQDEELADTHSRRWSLGAVRTRRIGAWQRTLQLNLQRETTRVNATVDPSTGLIPGSVSVDTLLIPALTFERVEADELINPKHGYRLRFNARGSHTALLSDSNFLRLDAEAKWIHSFLDEWRVELRGEIGATLTRHANDLPASQRFFTGGDQTVRGFGYNDLGPRDDAGRLVGGTNLVVASVELERHLFSRYSLAAFVDAGNAVDNFSTPLEASVGGGLHINTPVGKLRLEVAKAITESVGVRLHISLRPDL